MLSIHKKKKKNCVLRKQNTKLKTEKPNQKPLYQEKNTNKT